MMKKLPLQPSGWVVIAVGVASLVGALTLNWRELLVLAIGCAIVIAVAVPFVISRTEIALHRAIVPDRVTVGERAVSELTAENSSASPVLKRRMHDAIDDQSFVVELPAIKAHGSATVSTELPTDRRGVYQIGPARITKADPCRLMKNDVAHAGVDTLWVQPRVVLLPSLVAGLTKDIEGPTFDHSPVGDVAFHAVRPYRTGDDARHVHWMATARTGEMMVRHYVDNRQPYVSVVLDANPLHYANDDDFETAIEIVASLSVSALMRSQPISVHSGTTALVGRGHRSSSQQLLDELTTVAPDADFELGQALGRIVSTERETTVAVVVTGTQRPDEVRARTLAATRGVQTLVIEAGEKLPGTRNNRRTVVGARTMTVPTLDDFAAAFAQAVRA